MHSLVRLPAAGLIIAGGVVHLQLWRGGYEGIPKIGPMFLVNVAASALVAASLLVFRRAAWPALAGAALSAGSVAALLLSRTSVGVLGFSEKGWTDQAVRAVLFEAGALIALVLSSEKVLSRIGVLTAGRASSGRRWFVPAPAAGVAVVIAAVALWYGGGGGTGRAVAMAATPTDEAAVLIKDFKYGPVALTVDAGAPVVFTNLDSQPHTATVDAGDAFDTGLLGAGAAAPVTIAKPGRYAYHCSVHPYMTGTLTVE